MTQEWDEDVNLDYGTIRAQAGDGAITWQIGGTRGGMSRGGGEFIVPPGVTEMVVICIGGGQGPMGKRGGDSGEATEPRKLSVRPGAVIAWTVGAGGKPGENGGDTTFGPVVARGGGRYPAKPFGGAKT